jgi:FAD-dependent oxidoreductase domain-containing protein 1
MKYDVVVVGGAITGLCAAFHLLRKVPGLRVCVVEADPTYRRAATTLSTAGIRILFSQPETILMSKYGHEFFGNFDDLVRVGVEHVDLSFRRQGYLFLANTPEQAADMEANYELQRSFDCDVLLLDRAGLRERFPAYNTADVLCAAYSPHDGWIDPYTAVRALVRKVRALGADYLHARVVEVLHTPKLVTGVRLEDGRLLECDHLVNATGAWTKELSDQVGMRLPVEPLPRMVYFFEAREPLGHLPLTLDGEGAGFRPEGSGFISGVTEHGTVGRFCFEVDYRYFDDVVWPRLAHMVPAFEAIKLKSAWVGHYDQNTFDGNVVLGPWIGGLENYYVTAGSSGHGMQHAPAIGRAIAELIVEGDFPTIDLSRFSYQRILDNAPYPERGAKA